MVQDEAEADCSREPKDAQLGDLQEVGIGVENVDGGTEATVHRRSQEDQGQAHAGPPRLQVPAAAEAKEPQGAGVPLHHAIPLRLHGGPQSR